MPNYKMLTQIDPFLPASCLMADWAYRPDRRTLPLPNPNAWSLAIREHARTDAQVAMVGLDGAVWLAFPGTVTLRDWWMNARCRANVDMGAIAMGYSDEPWDFHRGFLTNASYLTPFASQFIKDHKAKRVYISGHSQGGGTGLLVAKYLMEACIIPPSNMTVTTLAQPAVGNRAAANFITRLIQEHGLTYHRIVNAGDPVPSALQVLGYRQPANLIYLPRKGDLLVNPSRAEFRKDHRPARIRGVINLALGRGVPAHSMATHLHKLGLKGKTS